MYFFLNIMNLILYKIKKNILGKVYWGLGIGDGDWGLGDWGLGPNPNPQSPNPLTHKE